MPHTPNATNSLSDIVDLVRTDPGLTVNIIQDDIDGGADAAILMNSVILQAIASTGVNLDGMITPDELRQISDAIRANPDLYADFVEGHGNDEGNQETGFHLVQGDGGAFRFQGRDFIDTIADAIYHVGFEYQDGRFLNEDGNANEQVDDVAGWLNWFVNGQNIVFGTDGEETLKSGHYSFGFEDAANEIFKAGGGDDHIWAGAGDDRVYGGDGNDTSGGDIGNDRMYGQSGDDTLWGDEGNDRLWGGSGHDKLGGGTGRDLLKGGAGEDRLGGDEGADTLWGGLGNDNLWGDNGNDTLWGGDGDDMLSGGAGVDTLSGDNGDDRIGGQEGNDSLSGGAGNDTLYGDEGQDHLSGGDGQDALNGGDGADILKGGSGADTLSGGSDDDILKGQKGADTLSGGEGRDIIIGGTGADVLLDWEDVDARDIFVFASGDSGTTDGNRDIVKGFNSGIDQIDLTAFAGITFIAADLFNATGSAEARYRDGILQVDEDGDGQSDLEVELYWVDALTTADVIL